MNLLYFALFMCCSLCVANDLSGKLIFSHVIFRHGDRTPVEPYPTDPWRDRKFWPVGFGQLTNIGKMQHFKLGKWLRNRYSTLLNETYSNDEIYIQSTDVDRTLMSALSNLAGLYQPKKTDIWDNDIQWQPIPVHTTAEKDDNVLAGKKPCPAYNYAMSNLKNSPEFKKLFKKYSDLCKYLTEMTGKEIELEDIEKLYNTLYIEDLYNKTLPAWTRKVYPNGDMKLISEFSFAVPTYTRKLARYKIGLLLKQIFDRFKKKSHLKSKVKQSVWVYSAHDTTIANVLNGLKLFEWHNPPYAACILIELRINSDNTPLISVFYKNTTQEPEPLLIPNCGLQCPLDKMYNLYGDILPIDWDQECKLAGLWLPPYDDNLISDYKSSSVIFLVGLFASLAIFMAVIYLVTLVIKRRHYLNYSSYVQ